MDPLSIVASVLGISKSVTSIADIIRWITSLKNVPLEFLDLQNELQTVLGYLDVLRHTLAPLGLNADGSVLLSLSQISICLRALETEVHGMQQFSSSFATAHRDGLRKLARKIDWKVHQDIIVQYRDRVRRRRTDLAHAVGLLQPAQHEQHFALLLKVQEANRTGLSALEDLVHTSTEQLRTSIDKLSAPGPASHSRIAASGTKYPEAQQHINLSATTRHRCPRTCPCQCHSVRRFDNGAQGRFSKLFGQLFLIYSSIPIWDPRPCDFRLCENQTADGRSDSIHLQYRFPAWLVSRHLLVSARWGSLTGPGASLHFQVPRVLPETHDIWAVLHKDDLQQLQSMLSSKQIYPTDVGPLGSILSVAFRSITPNKSVRTQEFLLTLCADSIRTWDRQIWALAYRNVHSGYNKKVPHEELYHRVLAIFGSEENEESTPLHNAILSKVGYPERSQIIQEAIRCHLHALNKNDGVGCTPLLWASRMQDHEAIRLLLEAGADPNAKSCRVTTNEVAPLLLASGTESLECVSLLIEHGADVNTTSKPGVSPVMNNAYNTSPASVMRELLSHGADPNHMSKSGSFALKCLAGEFEDPANESLVKLDLLLAAGAEINQRTHDGAPALFEAVKYNDHRYTAALLERGARLDITDSNGKGLLHYAARYATRQVMEVIRAHHCLVMMPAGTDCGVDPYLRCRDGLEANDYFRQRVEQVQALTNRRRLGVAQHKESLPSVSDKDVEEWVRLLEDFQSCGAYLCKMRYGPEAGMHL
ncbi:ankyrin repeat-containing domain protein [Cladorrhinum sp. PSN332]|nr:ankyrin repeat-containing domain protein [Cladorrhinum sp. PSN332]